MPRLLLAAFGLVAITQPGAADVTLQTLFGPLTDDGSTPVADGKLWIMVYDENNDGQFPGGLSTDGSLANPTAAHAAFAGVTLAVNAMVDGDRVFALGAVDSTDNPPGVAQNLLASLDVAALNLTAGRKWAYYWFPEIAAAAPVVPTASFAIGGINECAQVQPLSDGPMLIPSDGTSLITIAVYDTSLDGTLPATRFKAITAMPPADDFAAWIAGYFPNQSDPAIVGFTADPDGDGLTNGIESALGTAPNAATSGLRATGHSAGSLTFITTLNKDLPSDVTRTWRWSRDLSRWFDSGTSDGGTTVNVDDGTVLDASNPAFNLVRVTATASGTSPTALFVHLTAAQANN